MLSLEQATAGDNPPEGFKLVEDQSQPDFWAGPYYMARREGGLSVGFRVKERHLNQAGNCHGGMLANFADELSYALQLDPRVPTIVATISLTLDYLAPTLHGAWVESVPEVMHVSGRMLFFSAVITADGVPVVRCSGNYRVTRNATA